MKAFVRRTFYHSIFAILFFVSIAQAQQKRIYLAPDDHTDYMWTADEATYRNSFLAMTDYYLDRMDATAGNPANYQARWNADGSFWMWTYERNRTAAQFQRLINRIRDNHLSIPLNALVLVNGGTPAEAVLRGMYYPGLIERRYNVRFPLAVAMEDQTLPYGLPSLWAGAGARYSWKGVCGCVTRVGDLGDRDREIYYCGGADGSRVLMKWNSLNDNQNMGGYAETRNPLNTLNYLDSTAFTARYGYPVIGAFGQGWDDLQTTNDNILNAAQNNSTANRRIIVSNQLDFFQDFEANYGASLPTFAASYGNEWELYVASLAEVSARVKRAAEKLRTAEAMATLVALRNPSFMSSRIAARDTAMLNFGLYFEHDWTGDGPVARTERAAWQRRTEANISSYVNTLHDDAKTALGTYIRKTGTNRRVFIFNSLSWTRTDYADFVLPDTAPVRAVDLATGQETPSQIVIVDGERRLRILAQNIPSVGYKVFEIRSGAGTTFTNAAQVSGSVIENEFYRLTLSNAGAVTSLIDKTRANREFVRTIGGRAVNDFGVAGGTLSIENAGAVSVTLKAVSAAAPAHTSRITFVRGSNRIEIRNDVTQNFGDVRKWAFSFELNSPDVRHEEVGAVIRAKLLADGGNYSPKNARYDWLTLNHFADVSDGSNTVGVTVSNADCYYMQLGNSTSATFDTATPQINVLAGGQVDGTNLGIQNQNGDSSFTQRFALQTHSVFEQTAAMKFALEHQNPLLAGEVSGTNPVYDENSFSLATISDPNVLLWALKPAEDGIASGIAARVWNLGTAQSTYTLSLAPNITTARRTTHIETDIAPATIINGDLTAAINRQQIQTHLLGVNLTVPATAAISGRIATATGRGIGKVKITLTDPQNNTNLRVFTDGNGFFSFENVPTGGTVNLTPSRLGYNFTPSVQSFAHSFERSDLNFAARGRVGNFN